MLLTIHSLSRWPISENLIKTAYGFYSIKSVVYILHINRVAKEIFRVNVEGNIGIANRECT